MVWLKPVIFLFCISLSYLTVQARAESTAAEPRAQYIFPVGGQQGSTLEVRIEGEALADSYAVWTDCPALQVRVKQVTAISGEIWEGHYLPEKRLTHAVVLQVKISPAAEVGGHTLRLVSPRGISNPMPFRVSSGIEPLILEDENQTGAKQPIQGQTVKYPVVINGRIGRPVGGEVDYYGFHAEEGRELYFEVFFPRLIGLDDFAGGEMLLFLYKLAPTWVDPHRLGRLAFSDDPIVLQSGKITGRDRPVRARLKHRFKRSGRYLIAVKAFDDRGGPGFVYQLRIALPELQEMAGDNRAWPLAHPVSDRWIERSFDRPLSPRHLQELSQRTELVEPVSTSRVAADSPDSREGIPLVELPAIVEGAIDRPGKTDHFRFRAEAGRVLVFEVETPRQGVPRFHPWVRILDRQQEVVFSSIFNRVEGNNVMLQRYFEPKMVYRFEQEGEYTLEIRDLTSRYGEPDFAYRVMIRPQIPHIGELELDVERVNLSPGEAKRLTVTADREEGFAGEIALSVENLPSGVEAYPTAVLESYRPPPFDEGQKKVFRPEAQKVSITLIADEGASTTRLPRFLRVKARPVVNGVPGPEIAVGEVPLMVVAPLEVTATKGGE